MDQYKELEMERERLSQLVEDRLKRGLPINDELILEQNKKVDELLNKLQNK